LQVKAAVYRGAGRVQIEERPKPVAEPGEAIVRIVYCGICGTDLHAWLHDGIIEPGTVLGHEAVGIVEEVGSGVEGWKPGDRVAIGPPGSCGECHHCRHGRPNVCRHAFGRTIGISPLTDGAYAEYVRVKHPRRMLIPIPEQVTFEEAVLFDVIGVPFHGIRQSTFRIGDNVVVAGAGPIGLSAVKLLRMGGARHITVLEPVEQKRSLALRFGADLALDPLREGERLPDMILELYGGIGADVSFECSGSPQALATIAEVTKNGGETVILGVSEKPMPLVPARIIPREIRLSTSFVYDEDEIRAVFDLIGSGRLEVRGMITDIIALEDVVEKGFERLAASDGQIKILLRP
jgi:threonine dehydrogenase-like Zn-dependent dehydrogenase